VSGLVGDRRVSLAWPRLPAAAEVAIVAAGYFGYAVVRLAVRAGRPAAIAHAAGLWRAERWLHVDIEPSLNHLAAARPVLAETAGYYYGLAHFIVTPLVLAWLWLRRPAAFGPLRSALVLATTGANVVFWAWPAAPPRFAVPGLTDVLARDRILGAGDAHGPDSLVNLYAAMPSLHVAWAAWCAAAIVAAARGRWRHLAWLYPAATTVVVLATANHFVLDAAAGLAVTALGLLAARATTRPDATGPGPGGAVPAAASPAPGPGAATRHRRPVIWRRLARGWGWAVTGAAAMLIALRAPAVWADVRAALAHGLRLPWLGAAVAAAVFASAGLARLLPAGPAAAAAWQAGQYRRRDPAGGTAGVWAVLAGGVAATVAALAVLAAGAAAAARWWLLLGGAAALAEAGLLAAAFEVAGTPVPWRGLLLACAAGQLGARLVPLPGGLGGMEGGVLGALALTGTHPATALTAVIVYRVAGYWAPGAAGAVTAAVLTRRHPARAARPVTPLRPPPAPAATTIDVLATAHHYALDAITTPAVLAFGYGTAAPLPALARHAHLPCRARPPRPPAAGPPAGEPGAAACHPAPPVTGSSSSSAFPVSCTPPLAAASARSPPGPGVTGPAARHGCGPAPLPGSSRTSRRDSHRPPTERREERNMS